MIAAQLGEGVYHVGAQKGIDILRNKSAISGPVLGPVRVVATRVDCSLKLELVRINV